MRLLLYIVAPFLGAAVSLAAFGTEYSALVWVGVLGYFAYLSIRFYDKHHRARHYNSEADKSRAIAAYVEKSAYVASLKKEHVAV